jgi:PAS domain S-box-containing protein
MAPRQSEDELLRAVALQNAQAILAARQRAEEALARSLATMRATLEASTDGILAVDADGTITHFNERYLEMWGVTRDRASGTRHLELARGVGARLRSPDEFLARLRAIYTESPPETTDVLQLVDGRTIERFSRMQVIEARPAGRVWTFRDVTQRKQAEEALERLYESERAARAEAERMGALKDEFLATLSHELRTPLGAIVGWAQVLRRRKVTEAELQEAVEVIERNARMQAQLIEDLLDMSRITSGKVRLDIQLVEPAAFIEAAIETVRPAADAKGIRLQRLLDPAAGPVSGDPHRLQQVVWNLLSNAIKFTPRDGKVQVVLERVDSHVAIVVADNGTGIKPDILPHIFERFRQGDASTTRSHAGLGLGLSIVKSLVELHGGAVRAHSDGEGRGATFTVELPLNAVHRTGALARHPAAAEQGGSPFQPANLSDLTVLVVDDYPDARDLIVRILEECGARVLAASSAAEAVAMAQGAWPDLLVSDIGMPGTDGYELVRRLRELGRQRGQALRAIALTAFARTEDRTRALHAGFLAHVSKPVDASELVATLAAVAGRTGG